MNTCFGRTNEVSKVSPKQVFGIKKRDFLSSVGVKMAKSPKRRRAKGIEKDSEGFGKKHIREQRKKRREEFYQKQRRSVFDLRVRGLSMRNIAKIIGMSLGFVQKWCDRLNDHIKERRKAYILKREARYPKGNGIQAALASAPRSPKRPHRKITPEHKKIVKSVRREKFAKKMGAQKIKAYATMDISHQSINKILKEEELTAPRKKRKQRSFVPFRRGHSNELWQIDIKEFETGVQMFSIKDDYSSMILAADVRETWTTEDVTDMLERAIRLFGKPKQILSDHGTQFTSNPGSKNHKFHKWCSEKKIKHIMGKIRKPTTQGKIERWHGSVLEEAELPPKGSSVGEYRKAVLEYMEFYNSRRPHHGIGLQVPVNVYLGGLILPEVFAELGVHEVS